MVRARGIEPRPQAWEAHDYRYTTPAQMSIDLASHRLTKQGKISILVCQSLPISIDLVRGFK